MNYHLVIDYWRQPPLDWPPARRMVRIVQRPYPSVPRLGDYVLLSEDDGLRREVLGVHWLNSGADVVLFFRVSHHLDVSGTDSPTIGTPVSERLLEELGFRDWSPAHTGEGPL